AVDITVEKCATDTYRVIKTVPIVPAAYVLNLRLPNPWVQVEFRNYQQFNDNAVKAVNSLNTTPDGQALLPFPPSYNRTALPFRVWLKNWDSHDLPEAAGGQREPR
ncbi:MAG: hypothetical protein WCH75_27085, partial [Candidatus Binatia bacterium]